MLPAHSIKEGYLLAFTVLCRHNLHKSPHVEKLLDFLKLNQSFQIKPIILHMEFTIKKKKKSLFK